MDEIYSLLVTIDYPDGVTGGLRRTTDALRAVLERTRGDLTTAVVAFRLQAAIEAARARSDQIRTGRLTRSRWPVNSVSSMSAVVGPGEVVALARVAFERGDLLVLVDRLDPSATTDMHRPCASATTAFTMRRLSGL